MTWKFWLALVSVLILLAVGAVAGFGLMNGRVIAAQAKQAEAEDGLTGLKLQMQGQATVDASANAGAAEIYTQRNGAYAIDQDARSDASAQVQLSPSSLARLRAGDQQLCGAGGVVCRGRAAP